MLHIRRLGRNILLMVIVDERDGAGHLTALPPCPPDQRPTDQVPQSLGEVGVLPLPDHCIEPVQQRLFQRNPKTSQFRHLQITVLRFPFS
jgi:hypothetical protein